MGQCGCGENGPDVVYEVKGILVGIEIYPGCRDCSDTIGVAATFFTKKNDFIADMPRVKVTPDEYGGNGAGIPGIPIFSIDDLREAAKKIGVDIGDGDDQFPSLDDWLIDNGLEMVQEAIRMQAKRTAETRKP